MSFVSLSFLLFLPLAFALYWALRPWHRWQNLWLLAASYLFYGWWDWRFLLLIVVTSLSSYASGLLLHTATTKRRLIVAANICLNIGILALFKYYNFFVDNLAALLAHLGITLDAPTLSVILPVGISFYTFQSLSYTIDVYRRRLTPTRDAVAFFAYIAFFPQLVAGPIERATALLPQMLAPRTFRYDDAADGLRRMLWGFFKKMVVADNCAIAVNIVWADPGAANSPMLIIAMILFTFQIYCDFSGYSDIAIGTARLFGIHLNENFRLPYFAATMPEFWRRWHISLMTWFRDYVYIPLGGSRAGTTRTIANTIVVFLLSGLWHGANWTFILWGLYNALLIIAWRRLPLRSVALTFLLTALGWVLFRSTDISQAATYLHQMCALHPGPVAHGKTALLWCLLLVAIEWKQRRRTHPLDIATLPVYARWPIYYLLFLITFFARGEQQTFIYFQF